MLWNSMNVMIGNHTFFTKNLTLNLNVFWQCLSMLIWIQVLIWMIRSRPWSTIVMWNFLGWIVKDKTLNSTLVFRLNSWIQINISMWLGLEHWFPLDISYFWHWINNIIAQSIRIFLCITIGIWWFWIQL